MLRKISLNLNERSLDNISELTKLIGDENKTRAISLSLEIARQVVEMKKNGYKIILRKNSKEKEIELIF